MTPTRGLVKTLKGWLGRSIAGPETDPTQWLSTLYALPNPDPVLRSLGQAEQVFASIVADAHVIGDVRSIRGNFRSFNYRLNPGDESDPASVAACQLCRDWMAAVPPGGVDEHGLQLDWLEVLWQMTSSILYGYRAHEVTWAVVDGNVLPTEVIERPGRRFRFDVYGRPLLITRTNMLGGAIDHPSQFVISRHMPTAANPYGVALLSSCFWPWTFKTGGWRYFVKYCERHGLPWPFATYPQGTLDPEINALEKAVGSMLEAGYVVAPQGSEVQLITPTGAGTRDLPQQALIDLCNREMSKAITGQAMVAELQGVGARAASETASERQRSINDSDRDIAMASIGQVFRWITRFNFGDKVAPPWLEFFRETAAGKDRAESYQIAAGLGARPSRKAMLAELGMPEAENDDDALLPKAATPAQPPVVRGRAALRLVGGGVPTATGDGTQFGGVASDLVGFAYARELGLSEQDALLLAVDAADRAIEDHAIAPVAAMLERYEREGRTLAEFSADLGSIVGRLDDAALREVLERAITYSALIGAATQED